MKALNYISMTTALAAVLTLTSCETLLMSSGTTTTSSYDVYGGGYDTYGYGVSGSSWRATSSAAFAYDRARHEALFLSDKMAYELGLNDAQYEAVYEINLDYLLNITTADHLYSTFWARRNSDLFYVLTPRQYNYYMSVEYFYRPVTWYNNSYAFSVYNRYNDRNYYYRSRPVIYDSYRGGHNQSNVSYYQGRFGERTGTPPTVTNRTTTNSSTTTPRSYGSGTRQQTTPQSTSTQRFGNRGGSQTTTTTTQPQQHTIQPQQNTIQPRQNTTQPQRSSATESRTTTDSQKTESKGFGGRR